MTDDTRTYSEQEQRDWQNNLPKKNISAHVVLRHQGKALLVKPNYKRHWVLPGGVVDPDESPLQAAIRELKEETGVDLESHLLRLAGTSYPPSHHGFPERISFTFIHDLTEMPEVTIQTDEIEDYTWEDIGDLLVRTGRKRAFYVDLQSKISQNLMPFYSDLTIIP